MYHIESMSALVEKKILLWDNALYPFFEWNQHRF
jgi:hypothetical protein